MAGSEKLGWGTKIGYGTGDLFGGGSMVVIGFFYLYFLTDVILISPALAGVVFLISKGWDAVSDPLMGIISDRTRTRFGRRRPYFLAGVIFIFLAFFLMWYPINFQQEIHRFVYVLVAYVFFSTVWTMVMIPYFSMSSELTTDYNERTSLVTIRVFFSHFSSLVCAVVPLEIVKLYSDERTGYMVMAIIVGLFFALPYIIVFFSTRERKEFQKESQPFSFQKSFVTPFRTPTFVNLLFIYLFSFVTMDVVMSTIMYFMTYYMKRAGETTFVLGIFCILQIVALPIYSYISKRTSKKTSLMVGVVLMLIVMSGSLLLTPEGHPAIIYIFAALIGLASGGVIVMIYSIFPDVPDVDELYSGLRQEGIYSGLLTFMRKLGSALGIFIVSQFLSLAGYKKPIEQTVDGVSTLVKQQQTPEFFMLLKLVFALIPVVFLSICIFNLIRYRLTPEIHGRLDVLLNLKRRGEAHNKAEEESLKKWLERRDE